MMCPTLDLSIEEKAARRRWKNPPMFDYADWTPEAALVLLNSRRLIFFIFLFTTPVLLSHTQW